MSTQITLSDLKKLILDTAYPVNSYYITSSSENPNILLGGGLA